MTKKLTALLLTLLMMLSFCACGASSAQAQTETPTAAKTETPAKAQTENKAAEEPVSLEQLIRDAEAGDAKAMCDLGSRYYYGEGVEPDAEKARSWYEKAGDAGFADAYYYLGSYYQFDEEDNEQAEACYLKAAEGGSMLGCRGLGLLNLYFLNDYDKAEQWLLKAAEAGDSSMLTVLGDFYSGMGGDDKFDIQKAVEWYTKSTESDPPSTYGLFQLGQIYYNGNGVAVDNEKAFACFSRAVEIWKAQDSHEAFYRMALQLLGELYESGRGVEKDAQKAAECYQLAANM